MNRIILLLTIGILLLITGFAYADITVWAEHSTVKVRPFDPSGQNTAPHLYAAQNEWEAVQIVATEVGGGALTGCDVTVSPLSGPGSDITGIDLYREHYVYLDRPSNKPANPDDVGWWPDALIPFTDKYFGEDRDGAPFDVQAGWNQPIWIDIYVPQNQTPGDYQGIITVSCTGEQSVDMDLTITVWDFTLPQEITLPSAYGYSCSTVYNTHVRMGGSPDRSALTQLYYREALHHRLMLAWGHCVGPTWTWDPGTQTGTLDFTTFDAEVGPVLDGTLGTTGASFDVTRIPQPGLPEGELIAYWRAYAEHFDNKGWLEKLFLYLPDEPTPDEYPYLVYLADLLHQADPRLQAMTTEQFETAMAGAIDIWCPDEPLFSDSLPWGTTPDAYPPRQALGEKVWWYNCMSAQFIADYSDHFIDSSGMDLRIWQWLTRRYNFDGLLYWSTIYLFATDSDDPWTDQYANRFFCSGDGTMFYPGVPGKIGGTSDIPVSSIRMKIFREGQEDYEYFAMLDDMGYEDFVQTEVEKRAILTYQWERDYNLIEQSRHKLASLIMGTLDTTPPSVPVGLAVQSRELSLAVAWTPNVETDLFGYEISLSRYPGERTVAARPEGKPRGFTFDDLEPYKPYYIAIRAVDDSGNYSPWSDEVSESPLPQSSDDDDSEDDDDQDDDDEAGDDDFTPDDDFSDNDDTDVPAGPTATEDDNDTGGCFGG